VFARQLAWLARLSFHALSLEEVTACLERRSPWPRRSVMLTFDDGYEEIYHYAWPLLKRHRFPATLFITPAEVGLPGFATWEQLGEMARDGIAIGSHTTNHAYLPLVPETRLGEELVESKRLIEERLGLAVSSISYPVGGFTPAIQAVVQQAGYRLACTTNRARSRGLDPFALRRIKVTDRDGHPLLFLVKLSGYYDLFRQLKQPG
jgi:peptidoglycan/xylan/chitin deacetylase (PgdA/CDA1 family)